MTPRLPRPTPETTKSRPLRVLLRVAAFLSAPLLIGYPVLVYYSMRHYSARAAAVVLLIGISPLLFGALRASRIPASADAKPSSWNRHHFTWLWPLLALGLIVAAMFANSVQSLLLVPMCINGALLLSFGLTLFDERPLIERFARLQHEDLTAQEQQWCRLWTIIWTAFFGCNILLAGLFTLVHSLEWWTFYNGLIAYLIMGLLFSTEYVVRKWRFQRFGTHTLDRALRWCFLKMGLAQ